MNLNFFMQNGVRHIIQTAGRFYLGNKKGRAFLAGALPQMQKNARLREQSESIGTHVPAFLIASIAAQCNLHCAGCYARAGGVCHEGGTETNLTAEEWARIFDEAASLGISFILLAGGEPLMRREVLSVAARCKRVIFPVFTNGTMLDREYLRLFDENRNLIPILSIEGSREDTDIRRGAGAYAAVETAMSQLAEKGILFGASVTVSRANRQTVLTSAFLSGLRSKGCGAVVFVEYVPVQKGTEALALLPEDTERLRQFAIASKQDFSDMVILSFPGDEEALGGCLASGRGFFHINPTGGAEPCPFSPYAQYNLKNCSIRQVLDSGYFARLQAIAANAGAHTGGCVLFEREKEVRALLSQFCSVQPE